ncbi:alpha/beta-hydrolase [Dendrothele bispora CBS 962.96]|uniref:Alpha/beta-hydrolase n=1 Tax=Dendrothele bispora (strain CBS 962.96) TaxID=1314807 RepID=A0A4S8MNN1_DENBC|nr:alpha/beta-hydrolase [Dendrothele bispora CBS 962.96]
MTDSDSLSERPFQISIPDSSIELLQKKLALATFPDELELESDEKRRMYGAPLGDIKRLVERWKTGFDWRKAEKKLNEDLSPMFVRGIEVEGFGVMDVHYVHRKSEREVDAKGRKAVPLLFVHGWPGSVIEVRKILPLLTNPEKEDELSFHVVAPSLPGFGFSEAPRKKGFNLTQYAEVFNKLMLSLGYNEYVTQGGDWGFYITRRMAQLYGHKHVKAWHTNYPGPGAIEPAFGAQPLHYLRHMVTPYTTREKTALERSKWFTTQGMGYNIQQSTQPQTLGYSLSDSPVGLLAWVYEKLVNWTDGYKWNDDEVLEWVSVYWFSRPGPAASLRIYYEVTQANQRVVPFREKPTIPMGWSRFPMELRSFPRTWTQNVGDLVFDSEHPSGGHFAAHEEAERLVDDLQKMFSTVL